MELTSAMLRSESRTERAATQNQEAKLRSTAGNISSLRELTFKLLHKVQSMGAAHAPNIESGIDFYDEVTRFEIDLIERALVRTGGHQRQAARLLNLKVTTLNSKIKHYNIHLPGRVDNYPLAETDESETRRRA